MRRVAWILGTLLLALAGARTCAHAGGEEVIVIYNAALPESKAVADHYARKRAVPARQIFGFRLSTGSDMSRAEYRDVLLQPLVKALTNAGLASFGSVQVTGTNGTNLPAERRLVEAKFRYALLCYGVPWRIKPDTGLFEPEAQTARPEMRRNEAAVDSELACLPVCERPYPLVGPLSNPFYMTTNAVRMHPTNGVLMVARLDGPTPEIARGLVDKALEAERDGWWGRAYFDLRGNVEPALQQGEEWLGNAAQLCRQLGFETVVDTNADVFPAGFPMSQIAFYAGWYREHVCGPFALPEVEFMPGAFAYHLHSFSAASLHSTTQQWVGPFLAKGVTITMGSVQEPYLGGTPDIGVFAARLIFQGFSFGEAAYAAQNALSWQTAVVGDPLYRPYGRRLQELHDDLARRHSPLLAWSHLRLVNVNLANQSPVADMVDYIENIAPADRGPVLTEKLGDLYAAQGKPTSSAHAYGRALQLAPSPQQRVRLSLGLADKLAALGRSVEARAVLEQLLVDRPDYPDKPAISRRLVALASVPTKPTSTTQPSAVLNQKPVTPAGDVHKE
ncbi:MAG TPA: TIGR03790 family protein [Verrucomicrobiae bacterium]